MTRTTCRPLSIARSVAGASLLMLLATACITAGEAPDDLSDEAGTPEPIGSPDDPGTLGAPIPGSRVTLVSSAVSKDPLPAGQVQTITATLKSETALSNMIVDLRIYNASNTLVSRKTFEPVNFAAGGTATLRHDYQSPATLAVGTYAVAVGVWDRSWNTYLYEARTSFTVGTATTTPTPPPPSTTTCSYPAWVEYQNYAAGAIVTYQGALYQAKYANPGYIPTVSTYYWAPYACTSTTPPPPATSANLPAKIVGGYFTTWDFRNGVTLRSVVDTTNYNLIYIAFATGVAASSGTLQLSLPAGVSSAADFKSQVAYANSKGKRVIVSVGGWFDLGNNAWGYRLDSPTKIDQFMASMRVFRDTWGFNGMDWDLEHGNRPDVAGIVTASRRMRSEFGASFIIAAAPGVNTASWVGAGGVLDSLGPTGWDLVGEQVYDWNLSEAAYRAMIIDRMTVLSNKYGASKVVLGNKYKTDEGGSNSLADPANVCVDIATTKSALAALRASGVRIRGSFVWTTQSDADAGWPWQASGGVGGDILSN